MLNCKRPSANARWIERFNCYSPVELMREHGVSYDEYCHHVQDSINVYAYSDVTNINLLDGAISRLESKSMLECQKYLGQELPSVILPPCITEKTNIELKQWVNKIHDSKRVRREVRQLLNNLKQHPRGFGCDYDSSIGWFPMGDFSSRPIDMAGLAHEITHCLVNNQLDHLNHNFFELILSEFCAMYNELMIILKLPLPLKTKRSFLAYQNRIDELNFYFFRLEWGFHERLSCLHTNISLNRFLPRYLLLRETLWTAPGYQCVYAAASLLRRQKINLYSKQGDLL